MIDFIDMRERKSKRKVEHKLKEVLARDRARIAAIFAISAVVRVINVAEGALILAVLGAELMVETLDKLDDIVISRVGTGLLSGLTGIAGTRLLLTILGGLLIHSFGKGLNVCWLVFTRHCRPPHADTTHSCR